MLNNKIWECGQTYLLPNIQQVAHKDTFFKTPVHFGGIKESECFFWSTVLLMCCLELMCGNPETLVCAYSAATILINNHCLYIVISLLLNIFLIRSTAILMENMFPQCQDSAFSVIDQIANHRTMIEWRFSILQVV